MRLDKRKFILELLPLKIKKDPTFEPVKQFYEDGVKKLRMVSNFVLIIWAGLLACSLFYLSKIIHRTAAPYDFNYFPQGVVALFVFSGLWLLLKWCIKIFSFSDQEILDAIGGNI